MKIEDRMSMWAAKRPREEPAELMLEGAQEIADLRRAREEDGKQMSALIEGYQKMQALCVDGKYLTDEERKAIKVAESDYADNDMDAGCWQIAATLRSLLERFA
jgi:hypothetical protein